MRRERTLWLALSLIAVGITGLLVTAAPVLLGSVGSAGGSGGAPRSGWLGSGWVEPDSNGARIYITGIGEKGKIPRTGSVNVMGMVQSGGCALCHGFDGKGGSITLMMGPPVEVPDIRYSTLTETHGEEGDPEPGWTDDDIARAITEGVEPDGDALSRLMPRWELPRDDMRDLIEYLKELSGP